ncbi:MAG: hypothetical protein JSR93_04050 [Verrucomicrobia bacterium]|nr:hypothetical protein [Verrucomicrobiota bacterium]
MAFEIQQQAQQIAEHLSRLESMVNSASPQQDLQPLLTELGAVDEMAVSLANLMEFAPLVDDLSAEVLQSIQDSFQKVESLAAVRVELINGVLGGDPNHSQLFQTELEQVVQKCHTIFNDVLEIPGKTKIDALSEAESYLRGRVIDLSQRTDASPSQLEELGKALNTMDMLYVESFREDFTRINENLFFSKKGLAADFDDLLPLLIALNRFVAVRGDFSETTRQAVNQLVDDVRNCLSQIIVGIRSKSREQFLEAVATGNIETQKQIFPFLLRDTNRNQLFLNFLRTLNTMTRDRNRGIGTYKPEEVCPQWIRGQRALTEDAHPDDIAQAIRSVFPEDSSDRELIAQSLQEKLDAALDPQQHLPGPSVPSCSSSSDPIGEPIHQIAAPSFFSSSLSAPAAELSEALIHKLNAVAALSTMGFFSEEENAIEILTEQVNALEKSNPEAVHVMYGLMYHMHVQFRKFQPHDDYGRAAFLNQFARFSDRRIICNATPFERAEIIKRATVKALIGAIREAISSDQIDQVRKLMDQLSDIEPNARLLGSPGQKYPNQNLAQRLHYFLYDEHVRAGLDPSLRAHSDFGRVGFLDLEGFSAPKEMKLAALERLDQELNGLWM